MSHIDPSVYQCQINMLVRINEGLMAYAMPPPEIVEQVKRNSLEIARLSLQVYDAYKNYREYFEVPRK